MARELRSGGSFSELVRTALWSFFTRVESKQRAHRYQEVTLTPNGSSSVDSMMEWILARQPLVWDFLDEDGELNKQVEAVIRKELPKVQARRVVMRLSGMTMQDIGLAEGCSKQAVHMSLVRAEQRLAGSETFAAVLLDALGDDELGLTPKMLVEGARHV